MTVSRTSRNYRWIKLTSTLFWESHEQVLWPNPIKLIMIYHHKGSCIFKTAKQFWSWTWNMTSRVTERNERVALLFKPSEDTFSTNLYQLFLFYQVFTFFKKMEQPFCTKSSIYNVNKTTTEQYGFLDCDAMYYIKTGNNVLEQSLASICIRVQSEPKVIVHLPEMSNIQSPCTLIQIHFSLSQEQKVGCYMCHKSHRP